MSPYFSFTFVLISAYFQSRRVDPFPAYLRLYSFWRNCLSSAVCFANCSFFIEIRRCFGRMFLVYSLQNEFFTSTLMTRDSTRRLCAILPFSSRPYPQAPQKCVGLKEIFPEIFDLSYLNLKQWSFACNSLRVDLERLSSFLRCFSSRTRENEKPKGTICTLVPRQHVEEVRSVVK